MRRTRCRDASLGIPPAFGAFAYDAGSDQVRLTWPATDPGVANFVAAAQQTLSTLDQRTGSLTRSTPQFRRIRSAAPSWGQCVISPDVWPGIQGYTWFDGALIEGSAGLANPSFTIAERCMDRILEEDHLSNR
jgi:hypothetical protein